ncbi:MAG: DUF6318 family protein [Gammaproteobacteria bacterium]
MRSFALTLATLFLLTSCTDDPKPIEPTPSASATPTQTEPTMPPSAREDTPSGAANFVDYWVDTFNYGARTGEVQPMLEDAGDCKPCRGYARDFESLPRSKRPKGSAWTLTEVRVGPNRDPIEVVAEVRVLGESKIYPLTFVLNPNAPFKLTDIFERGKS